MVYGSFQTLSLPFSQTDLSQELSLLLHLGFITLRQVLQGLDSVVLCRLELTLIALLHPLQLQLNFLEPLVLHD